MRSFELVTLTPDEFDEFAKSHPQGSFQQTKEMGNLRAQEPGKQVEYLGVRENGKLVGVALLQNVRTSRSAFSLISDGPLVDFDDRELVEFFTQGLKDHAKRAGSSQLDITPEALYQLHTQEGEPLGEPDTAIDSNLRAAGYERIGADTGYTAVPRWRWVKDLSDIHDEQELLATYMKYRRRNVRIARESGVHTRRLDRSELHLFHELCELSCEKQGFENRPLSFFENMYDAFGDDIEYRVAELHIDEYLANWQGKLDALNADIARIERDLERSKTEKRTQQLNTQLEKTKAKLEPVVKRVEEAQKMLEEYGPVVPIDGSMFLFHPREVICTTSGADERFDRFYAPALVHHEMMLRCVEQGVPRYNLYGVNGIFTKENNPGFGVLEFKQRFNGFVEEMPGDYVLPVRPAVYWMKKTMHRVMSRSH